MKYDIVIIGGGLGGLISGLILSKEGMSVCILEQHHKPGGNLQSFTRDGCIFDTGMHYIGSLSEGQYLHRYFKYFDITERLKFRQLDLEGYDTISFNNDDNEYKMSQGHDRFIADLHRSFPDEKDSLETYIKKIRSIVSVFPFVRLEETQSYTIDLNMMRECSSHFFSGLTHNDRLRNVLGSALSLYPGHAAQTPLYVHACMRDSLINSCWKPIGGSQQIADAFVEKITENGGKVLTAHQVKKIMVNDENKAEGVLLQNNEKIFAEKIISNAHPASTMKLIEEGKIRKVFRKRIMGLKNTQGAFTIYAVLKKNSFPYLNRNYFHYANAGALHSTEGEGKWPENFYFYTPAKTIDDKYAESIVVIADMNYEEVSRWIDTRVNKRGEEYKIFKQEKADILLNKLEERLPGIKGKIEKFYTSTPLTFRDYTATHEGSAYGVLKDCSNPLKSIILPRTKISNLFFTGQNLNLHGFMGVTAAAMITCSEIVGLKYLTKKISNA